MKLSKLLTLCAFIVYLPLEVKAQIDQIVKNEDQLVNLYNDILVSEGNNLRDSNNSAFYDLLKTTLSIKEAYDYPFDRLPTISKMNSDDKSLRIFTWNLQNNEGVHDFYGIVQINPKLTRNKEIKVMSLENQKGELIKTENKSYSADKWPGAVYYQIITVKKGKKKYYTLAGWRGIDNGLTQKLIDVIYLSGENVKFGYPIFKMEKKTQRRIVFSYSAKATMHLNYNDKLQQFTFDHLAPSSNLVIGQYRFYGPDGSYDAVKLEKKSWAYIANIDAKNQGKTSDLLYTPVTNPEIED